MSAKNLPRGQTQVLKVRRIRRIDCHPFESDADSAPQSISDTKHCLTWNGDLVNRNECKVNRAADNEFDTDPANGIKCLERTKHSIVSAALNVPALIRPTRRSLKQAEQGLVTVSATETRRNKGNQTK